MKSLRRIAASIREFFSRDRARALPLEELLERAGVPRSAPPELLRVAQMAGLALDGEGDGDGDDGDGDGDGDDGDDGSGDDGDDGDDGDGDGDDGDDGDDEDGELKATREENRALKRRLSDETKAKKSAERKLKSEQREKQKKNGQYEQMFKDEKERREELEGQLKGGALDRAITSEASRQNFRSPDLAVSIVKTDLQDAVDEDGDVDEDRVRDSLKKLAKREPGLVKKSKRQGDVTGEEDDDDDDDSGSKKRRNGSSDDDEKLTPRERMRRGHEEIERKRAKAGSA